MLIAFIIYAIICTIVTVIYMAEYRVVSAADILIAVLFGWIIITKSVIKSIWRS